MFTNEIFQRTAKAARLVAIAGVLAATIPAGFALAQGGHGGGGGGGGGGGNGGSGDGRGNAVLQCLGPDCINVSRAQIPCTSAYCKEEKEKIEVKVHESCEVRVCDIENGRRICWTEVSLDERICIKHKS